MPDAGKVSTICAGIDVGCRTIKVVLVERRASAGAALAAWEVRGRHLMFPEGLDMDAAAERAFEEALDAAGISRERVKSIVATCAGRKQVRFADSDVTEVSADARGARFVHRAARTVIDVGAEESRAIKTNALGKLVDFACNDKCAAGTGSFAESMARALQMTLKEFGAAGLRSVGAIAMNAQCTVFAESEVVSLIHAEVAVDDIAKAVLDAVANRVCAMLRRVGTEPEVILIGGMAHNPGFVRSLKAALGTDHIHLPASPESIGALGAALIAGDSATA